MNDFLSKLNIKPYKYKYINKALIIYSDNIYVLKKNSYKNRIYKYLDSTDFKNYIKPIKENENFYLYNFLNDNSIDDNDKSLNLINELSNLHSNTISFKELNLDRLKEIKETYENKIDYLYKYYNNLEDSYNKDSLYSPSTYLFLRNVSKIYYNLDFSKNLIKIFYDKASKNNKYKECLILGKVRLDNFINNKFTNFDHSLIKSPLYDLIDFYKEYYDKVSFNELYKVYKENLKLNRLEELFFMLSISVPYKITFKGDNYVDTLIVHKLINYIDITKKFIISNNKIYLENNNDKENKENDSI